jgi:uncharacterized protein (DUF488 family)
MSDPNARPASDLHLMTIGVYGADEDSFFSALTDAGVDTFCDVRRHRGLRGRKYAFANSKRLQKRLKEMGINYVHLKDLSPPKQIRQKQKEADKKSGTAKRERTALSSSFVEAYEDECLSDTNPSEVLNRLPDDVQRAVFFCVEREPEACHRSVLTSWLSNEKNLPVEHLKP